MTERIVVSAGSPGYEAIRAVLEAGSDLVLDLEPSRSVALFEPGDRVVVPFDDHWGPAVVESADNQYVRIKYGPRGRPNDLKFRTSIERASVRTDNRRVIPAVVTVLEPVHTELADQTAEGRLESLLEGDDSFDKAGSDDE